MPDSILNGKSILAVDDEPDVLTVLEEEIKEDMCLCTPEGTDGDGDGKSDICDNCPDVVNPNQEDADGDGKGDVCDPTPGCGGCGQPQCEQVCPPPTTSTTTIPDTDSDGILDNVDNCPNICNTQQLDADGDLIGDVCDDPNNDGCGGCGQPLCETPC